MRRTRKKQRKLGAGSWWATGHRTLHNAHVNIGSLALTPLEQYLDGLTIP